MPDAFEKGLARKTANVFGYAARMGYSPVEFTRLWYNSETAWSLYNFDFNSIAQSYYYQFNSLEMELKLSHKEGCIDERYPDVMFWVGYIFTYWMYLDGISWQDIENKYDVPRIINAYDTLHTLSTEGSIRVIKEDFKK